MTVNTVAATVAHMRADLLPLQFSTAPARATVALRLLIRVLLLMVGILHDPEHIFDIYIYIYARPPPRSTLRGSKAFALRTPSTYALERKTEREQERRREFIARKKDRENKQIRTCVPVLLNGRMA